MAIIAIKSSKTNRSARCQAVIIFRVVEWLIGMKPSHLVNSAPQLLHRMFRISPGVMRIQCGVFILQKSVWRQYGHRMFLALRPAHGLCDGVEVERGEVIVKRLRAAYHCCGAVFAHEPFGRAQLAIVVEAHRVAVCA